MKSGVRIHHHGAPEPSEFMTITTHFSTACVLVRGCIDDTCAMLSTLFCYCFIHVCLSCCSKSEFRRQRSTLD